MVIELLPVDIPKYWDAIKFMATEADEVPADSKEAYFNDLLSKLLSSEAQCWIRLNDDRVMVGLFMTLITVDKLSGDKTLEIRLGYSWEKQDISVWEEDAKIAARVAKREGCKYVTFFSRNPAIWNLAERTGFGTEYRMYKMKIGG